MVSQKQPLIILKIILLYKYVINQLQNNFFLLALGVLIFALSFEVIYLLLFLGFYLLYLFKKDKHCFYVLICCICALSLSFLVNKILLSPSESTKEKGIVIDVKEYDDYNKITIKKLFTKTIVYDSNKYDVEISDRIICTGTPKEITSERVEYGFNMKNYYYGIRVNNVLSAQEIEISKSINIYTARKYIYKYLDFFFNDEVKIYLKALVMGDSSNIYDDDIENIKINGISHLFAISGLHISLLIAILTKLLLLINIKEKRVVKINVIVLICYMVITNFLVSVCRASLLYIIKIINDKYKMKLTSLDIISILFILFIIFNPSYLYNLSFQLSFLASFFIILFSKVLSNFKEEYQINSFIEIIVLTLVVQIVSFPITTNLNNNINCISFISNVFFITFVSYLFLPLSFITFLLPIFQYLYKYFISLFIFINDLFAEYIKIVITLPDFSKFETICYYLFLICILSIYKHKKYNKKIIVYLLFISFLFLYYQKINLNIQGEVNFLDMYEGDTTVINLPLDKGIIVIDTGTGKNDALSDYLASYGVRNIDALVLTHNHNDHNGEALEIINKFNVNKIIISAYDNSEIPANTIVKAGDSFKISEYSFKVLSPTYNSSDPNDVSIVIHARLGNYDYLFLGDATYKVEESLKQYNLSVDVVKVGHHGSSTSTNQSFYEIIKPKIVIIETGQVKYYGFPNQSVVEYLEKYQLYRTDKNYSIKIKFTKKKSIISSLK